MKISKSHKAVERIVMKTRANADNANDRGRLVDWSKSSKADLARDLCDVASYLKTNQQYRMRQLATSVRLYAGLSVYSYAGSSVAQMDRTKTLPDDRPTFNLIQACVDTLLSRLSQSEPQPKFLTDNADYRQRHLAQRLNQFILGEFYQTHAYEKAVKILRDCLVMGVGCLKVYEGDDHKVCVDRVMPTDLFVDTNDDLNGEPQQLFQLKLVDRDKLLANNPKSEGMIAATPASVPTNDTNSARTISDQVMVVEGWKLPSGSDKDAPGYTPGRHTIATVAGTIFDEDFTKPRFPFVFMQYAEPFLGYWGQGIATQLYGTQMTLNRILYTIARAITLVGVPRIFQEQSSKVCKAHNNNEIGTIITYSGIKPSYEVAACNAPEMYEERDRLIQYGFQQTGVSAMQATSQKPEGLTSGAAIRSYDDISTDRFASISKKYDNVFRDLAYLIAETAKDIAERDGKYQTVFPDKDGSKEVDLPAMKFLKNPFVIQCFTESSLPRTPAGRIAKVTEMVQAGMINVKEGRRLMRFPDLESNEQLDNASEERIFQMLDSIVEDGKYMPPDVFIDTQLATTLCVQYINLYLAARLEESKADMLRDWFKQVQAIKMAAMPAPAPQPTAAPMPAPQSNLVPNTPAQ